MPSLDSIVFNLDDWEVSHLANEVLGASALSRLWINSCGDELSLHVFDRPPDLPAPLADIVAIRNGYRDGVSAQGGGVVSVDTVTIAGLAAVETVFKYPQQPHGMTYVGAITLPFRQFSLVVRVMCAEIGTTGLRDSMILGKMIAAGTVALVTDGTPRILGWARDPYDPAFAKGALRNSSDDETWDVEFRDHPVSRVRACLKRVRETCRVARDLDGAAAFEGPQTRSW